MQTFTGRQYWPLDPRADEVDIRDIAHHLSMLCRFTGAVRRFYSVAEHSVYVSKLVPPEFALQGLLHDAAEAYCADIGRPLKPWLMNYGEIEYRNARAILEHFGIEAAPHDVIKAADNAIVVTEHDALMGPLPAPSPFFEGTEPAKVYIAALASGDAEAMFLSRFRFLTKEVARG